MLLLETLGSVAVGDSGDSGQCCCWRLWAVLLLETLDSVAVSPLFSWRVFSFVADALWLVETFCTFLFVLVWFASEVRSVCRRLRRHRAKLRLLVHRREAFSIFKVATLRLHRRGELEMPRHAHTSAHTHTNSGHTNTC